MIQLSLFATADGRMVAFMECFARINFGRPDSWCNCQRCTYARLAAGIQDGAISPAAFKPFYDRFIADAYLPRNQIKDPWNQLAQLSFEFSEGKA